MIDYISLPFFAEKIGYTPRKGGCGMFMEERLHLFATMMALYPHVDTQDLADEFHLTTQLIKQYAMMYGIKKTPLKRSLMNKEIFKNSPKSRAYVMIRRKKNGKN